VFNVSTLLLDDALLKCVVAEVFSISQQYYYYDSVITHFILILTVKKGLKIGQYLAKLRRIR